MCGVLFLFYCYSQFQSDPEWLYLLGNIYGSNRSVRKLFVFDRNTRNYICENQITWGHICLLRIIIISSCLNHIGVYKLLVSGGARGVMVIVVGNGHGDTSSKPGRDWLHFT